MKNESGCDMFLSIHLNAFPQTKYYGAQVWYGDSEKSKSMARILQKNFKDNLDNNNDRLEKPARNSYKILRNSREIPAVLAECGFLSNVEEAEKLNSAEYQEKIAETIVQSVNMYFVTEGI
jgi:N-acetylmuramoyl-L-alanine amidase